MFELSEAELQVLEELWKLIQTERTLQELPSNEARREILREESQPLDTLAIQKEARHQTTNTRHISFIYLFKRRAS